jgi:hypothetical protein
VLSAYRQTHYGHSRRAKARTAETLVFLSGFVGGMVFPHILMADCIDYESKMHWVGGVDTPGPSHEVAIQGTYAYVTDYSGFAGQTGLRVIDISNPASPVIVGNLGSPLNYPSGVRVSGSLAYVADAYGLYVIDVSNPASPTIVGSVSTTGSGGGIAISGSYVWMCDGYAGLQVIDVSAPALPIIVGTADTPGFANNVALSGSYAFVADVSGLTVIDISNPLSPMVVGGLPNPEALDQALDLAVSDSYVYLTGDGLQVIDISNPSSPVLLGNVTITGDLARGIALSGQFAYLAVTLGGMDVYDISDPGSPTFVNSVDLPGYGYGIQISGSEAYVADDLAGLQVIHITNPEPLLIGSLALPGSAQDVAVSGSYAFIAADWEGLQVVDISNPASPTSIGGVVWPFNSSINAVALYGSYAYVAPNLNVVDISNPASPSIVGSAPGSGSDVVIIGSRLYAASGGVQVFDISNPISPTLLGSASVSAPFGIYYLAVSGHYAYLSGWSESYPPLVKNAGIRIVDISNPTQPVPVGGVDYPGGHFLGVAASGSYAYVADWFYGVRVFDVSNPASPHLVASVDTPGNPYDIKISGSIAYVADRTGMQVIDISNPASPKRLGDAPSSGFSFGVAVSSNNVFIADGTAGLKIFPAQCSAGGGECPLTVQVTDMQVDPNTINAGAGGNYITAYMEFPAEYDPAQVILDSVRLNGTVAASPDFFEIKDWNHNHVPDLALKFARQEVDASLTEGDRVPVSITGMLGEVCFAGMDSVRVIRPRVTHPNGGESFLAGVRTLLEWENPAGWPVGYVQIYYSADGGNTWNLVADHIEGTSYVWEAPPEPTDSGRLRVVLLDDAGVMGYDSSDGPFAVRTTTTGIDEPTPTVSRLYQNSPNPFRSATRVSFDIAEAAQVTLKVFDLTGREVRVLATDWYPAGRHEVSWDAQDGAGHPVSGGIYFLRLTAGSFTETHRMYLQK